MFFESNGAPLTLCFLKSSYSFDGDLLIICLDFPYCCGMKDKTSNNNRATC